MKVCFIVLFLSLVKLSLAREILDKLISDDLDDLIPHLDSSIDNYEVRAGKFLVYTTTTTSTTYTDTFVQWFNTFRTCFVIAPITMSPCTTTSLDLVALNVTGLDLSDYFRKKRSFIDDSPILALENEELLDEFEFEEEELPFLESEVPMIEKDGKVVPFFEFISKVRDDYPQPETTEEGKKVEPTKALERHPRFLTVLETFTTSENFTTTITTTNLALQTLFFTSVSAIAPRACYPLDFLEENLIDACVDVG